MSVEKILKGVSQEEKLNEPQKDVIIATLLELEKLITSALGDSSYLSAINWFLDMVALYIKEM